MQSKASGLEAFLASFRHAYAPRQPYSNLPHKLQQIYPSLVQHSTSFLASRAVMGSKRSTEDLAADKASADADAGPGPAAAADQPSSSGEQFVNAGAVTHLHGQAAAEPCLCIHAPGSDVAVRSVGCVQACRPGWNAGGSGRRSHLTTSAQRGSAPTRECSICALNLSVVLCCQLMPKSHSPVRFPCSFSRCCGSRVIQCLDSSLS